MAKRFINDDVKLKNGGRKAIKISQEDLAHLMYQRANKFLVEEWGDDAIFELADNGDWCKGDCYDELIQHLMEDKTLMADVSKYDITCCSEATFNGCLSKGTVNLTGMHTLKNGLTFYGFFISVDCGPSCAFMIIYHDGQKLRAYVPTRGNTVNVDFKCVVGMEYDSMVDATKIETKYRKLGIWRTDNDFYRMYLAKYNLDEEFCFWDAIQQDIEARIEVL
jgi:hypothetical protein